MVMLVFGGVHQLPIPCTGLYKARLGSTITLQQLLTIGGACDFDRTKRCLICDPKNVTLKQLSVLVS